MDLSEPQSSCGTTAQINFEGTVGHKCARPSNDHHRRRQDPSTVPRCSQTHFPHTFPCHSDYSHLRTIFANIQLLFKLWTIRRTSRNRGPDALLSVAQAMRCVCEIPQPSAHHCGSVAARQPQLSQGKALPIMTIFGASPTFKK